MAKFIRVKRYLKSFILLFTDYNTFLLRVVDYILTVPNIKTNAIHNQVVIKIEEEEKVFFTEHRRPKNSENLKPNVCPHINFKTAIVLQGPLMIENDFTYETIVLYKKAFADSYIIVSTWEDEREQEIRKIESLGVHLILNKKPSFSGISNINYQITSSYNGINKAKELGSEYVLKTRTDQRIYNSSVINFFINLITLFPLQTCTVQKKRLIIPSINTFLYRMYGATDMMMFGHIDDMCLYWNTNLDSRELSTFPNKRQTLREFALMNACEIYLCTEFLNKIKKELLWTLKDSWKVFAQHFCVIDHSTIDLYWPKYEKHCEYRNTYYSMCNTHQLIGFKEWMALYLNEFNLPSEDVLLNYSVADSFELTEVYNCNNQN